MPECKEEVLTVVGIEKNGCTRNGNGKYKVYFYKYGFVIANSTAALDNYTSINFTKPRQMLVKYTITKNGDYIVHGLQDAKEQKTTEENLKILLQLLKNNTTYLTDFYFFDLMNNKKITHKLYTDIVKQINNGISQNLDAIKL